MPRGFGEVLSDIETARAELADTDLRAGPRWKRRVERLLELYAEGIRLAATFSQVMPL
jgi:hypothetical protein